MPCASTLFALRSAIGITHNWFSTVGSNLRGNTAKTPTEGKTTCVQLTHYNVSEERAASIFTVQHKILVSSMDLLSVSKA